MDTFLYCDRCEELVSYEELEREGISIFDELVLNIAKHAVCKTCHSKKNVRLVIQISNETEE